MTDEYRIKTIVTIILSIAMLGFALAFYAMGSAVYLVLLLVGIALAFIAVVSEPPKK